MRGFCLISSCSNAVAIEEAVGPVSVAEIGAFGEALATLRHGVGATRMEATAGGRGNQAGDLSTGGYFLAALAYDAIWIWSGRKQKLGIGVLRMLGHLFRRATFDGLSSIHYQSVL